MTQEETPLRVGIGASAGNSWASRSHIPAVAAVDGLTLTSIATSRPETAQASAEQFGVKNAFVGTQAMVESDEVVGWFWDFGREEGPGLLTSRFN